MLDFHIQVLDYSRAATSLSLLVRRKQLKKLYVPNKLG